MSALEALAASAREAGVFCDFDGCLAPIVPDPEDSRAVRGAVGALTRLAGRFRVVAVVSGRSVADLSRRVRAPGVRLLGLHGMEERVGRTTRVAPEAEAARASIDTAGERLARELRGVRGALLERKGLALAVHFRRADDPDAAERLAAPIVAAAAADVGLAVVPGRRILEVRPPAGGDKGDAVRRIIAEEGLTGGLVAGDDVGDVSAFEAIRGLAVSLAVAVASAEAPAGLIERADVVVGSPSELVELLRTLER